MQIKISPELKELASIFPLPLYAVGGFVRDSLLGYNSQDVDLASALTPDEVKSLLNNTKFKVADGSKKLLTLIISVNQMHFEYTTFRSDSYAGGHRPQTVIPCNDIVTDALRRDFTINAIYYDIKNQKLVDPLGGIEHLQKKELHTTRLAKDVFSEDGLRLMRLARFSAELDLNPSPEVLSASTEYSYLIKDISKERIRDELDKILVCDLAYGVKYAHYNGLLLLEKIGVLGHILPDIQAGKGMAQRSDYHKYDVLGHILHAVKASAPSIRLATLMHDIAKPKMKLTTGFYRGHDKEGGKMTKAILSEFRYPKSVIEETARLVENHMFNMLGDVKKNTMRRFLQKNSDIAVKLTLLKYADHIGSGVESTESFSASKGILNELDEMKAQKVPFFINELLVKGEDLKKIEFIPENKRAEVLKVLLEECALYGSDLPTNKEKQLSFIYNYARRQLWITE